MVFEQICNSRWFTQTSMILFLNKIDLFQEKLRYSSLSAYFPDFKGISPTRSRFNTAGNDKSYLEASRYFQKKFIRLNKSTEKEVYAHFTNATGLLPPKISSDVPCRYQHSAKRHGLGSRHHHEQQFPTSHFVILHTGDLTRRLFFVSSLFRCLGVPFDFICGFILIDVCGIFKAVYLNEGERRCDS
jgi:G-protein alpha subunit